MDVLGADFRLVQCGWAFDFTVEGIAVICVVAAVFFGGVDADQQHIHDSGADGYQGIGNQNAANHAGATAIATTV